ncbi:5-formyltetrahydrofolate cyclo-ligase [Ruminiclostridium herbifermentans]|uniref:5-formyltetrahydrofolate cyclo-ligase n=1 Tax=Ruminiclostridium herbifermentans TaxID=2488810 RepID=UPI002456E8D1|nr:5-formyltetrahydrofolate cyclo-ligase [Ruminiclostridium herbifermentans]
MKDEVRKNYIAIRKRLQKHEVIEMSEAVADRLKQLEIIKSAKSIMCFVSFGNEVNTHELIKMWLSEGKQVSVPSVVNSTKEARGMYAVKINSFDELKEAGKYGILEPPLLDCNIITPALLDVVIVPGSAFDVNKNRMGYGAGYYDRFLSNVSQECCKIGICYDFQVLDKIPYEEYDVPLDLLVTEKRVIY